VQIKNNSTAPQGIHTKAGQIFLAPGESRSGIEFEEGQEARARRLRFLTFGQDGEDLEKRNAAPAHVDAGDLARLQARIEELENENRGLASELQASNEVADALRAKLAEGAGGDEGKYESRHVGGGKYRLFLNDEQVGDETFTKDEAAAEVEKRNAAPAQQ
jgi:hypothetical protein